MVRYCIGRNVSYIFNKHKNKDRSPFKTAVSQERTTHYLGLSVCIIFFYFSVNNKTNTVLLTFSDFANDSINVSPFKLKIQNHKIYYNKHEMNVY